jgi:hypothetical protein
VSSGTSDRKAKRPAPVRAPNQKPAAQFPRRNALGRVDSAAELIGAVVLFVAVGTILVAAVDGIATLAGRGSFGRVPGWPAAILAVWMFVEEFRAWRIGPARIGLALVGAALGVFGGGLLASFLDSLQPLLQGAIAALLACLIYATLWFYGIRLLADRSPER